MGTSNNLTDRNTISYIEKLPEGKKTPDKIANTLNSATSNKNENNNTFIYIDNKSREKVNSNSTLLGITSSEVTAAGSVLTALLSVIVAISTVKKYSKDYKLQLKQRKDLKEGQDIEKAKLKIEKFYGPLNAYLEESRLIYELFAKEEKKSLKNKGNYFRTLRFLTNEPDNSIKGIERFKPHDQELLNHILNISDQIIKLIEENSGHVDNPSLHTLLGKLAAHYRVIKSASEGKLTDQANFLEDIVFPLEINGAINSEISKLINIINRKKESSIIINKTIRFYEENYLDYYNQTSASNTMKFTYDLVREFVVNGSSILDAGCGVGRDTKYFIQHGFKVVSFDASTKMVEMCNEYPFSFCEHESFSTIKYPPTFDLVWACASLLHLDEPDFKDALYKLHRALKPNGVIYFSLKSFIDESKNTNRNFYKYQFEDVRAILESEYNMQHLKSWSSISTISSSERFENYIYRK